jgi:hypothetical protein
MCVLLYPKHYCTSLIALVIVSSIYKRVFLFYCDIKQVLFLLAFFLCQARPKMNGRSLLCLLKCGWESGQCSPGLVKLPFFLDIAII